MKLNSDCVRDILIAMPMVDIRFLIFLPKDTNF